MGTTHQAHGHHFVAIDPAIADSYRRSGAGIAVRADSHPGYPCRQCLRDAEIGDELILVPHDPFDGVSPYTGSSPIYLHRAPCTPHRAGPSVPEMLASRLLSLRGYDRAHMLRTASVTHGERLAPAIAQMLADDAVSYIQVHNAGPGCWNCRIERTPARRS